MEKYTDLVAQLRSTADLWRRYFSDDPGVFGPMAELAEDAASAIERFRATFQRYEQILVDYGSVRAVTTMTMVETINRFIEEHDRHIREMNGTEGT